MIAPQRLLLFVKGFGSHLLSIEEKPLLVWARRSGEYLFGNKCEWLADQAKARISDNLP
jgi:hypothetical protein